MDKITWNWFISRLQSVMMRYWAFWFTTGPSVKRPKWIPAKLISQYSPDCMYVWGKLNWNKKLVKKLWK